VSYRCSVPNHPHPRVIAVVGPTAAGKSALSVGLAQAMGGEIVNADSMQLYRGMDIGTAKLPLSERNGVAHHVLDIWDVSVTASVAEYQRLARAAADRIATPILVGGSGLYIRAVLEDFAFPGTDPAIRARLEAELSEGAPLYERLRRLDPAAATKILPSNGRRVVRALEVIELTGRPFTASLPSPIPVYESVQIGVDRDDLDSRVDQRVDLMWEAGLVDEVAGLDGLRDGLTASRALGYQQALAQLDGVLTETEARAATKQATRRFVRRQRSWFRRDPRITWLDGASPTLLADALALAR
jgi:tRNA dimethylallyltransferase